MISFWYTNDYVSLSRDLISVPEEQSDDDLDDFDPRAQEEFSGGNQSPVTDDDDFDPRAQEQLNQDSKTTLHGLSPIPSLVPPPRPSRPCDKNDHFTSNNQVLDQFNEMQVTHSLKPT